MSIYEVARRAGVSKSTVSRVINDAESVADATAKAVHKAMRELGYSPSPRRPGPRPKPRGTAGLARRPSLRYGAIALVNVGRAAELLNHPYFVRLQTAIRARLAELGVSLMLDAMAAPDLPLCIREQRVDGVLMTGQSPRPDVLDRLAGFPAVWISGGTQRPTTIDHVLADNDAIGILAAEYLLTQRCTRVACANADPAGNSSAARVRAFETRLREAGLAPRLEAANLADPRPDDWDNPVIRKRLAPLLDRLFDRADPPDGLFLPYDQHAMLAAQLLSERGLRAGGPGERTEVILISGGQEDMYLDPIRPRPASIDPNPMSMGRWAVDRLMDRIAGNRDEPVRVLAQPKLIIP